MSKYEMSANISNTMFDTNCTLTCMLTLSQSVTAEMYEIKYLQDEQTGWLGDCGATLVDWAGRSLSNKDKVDFEYVHAVMSCCKTTKKCPKWLPLNQWGVIKNQLCEVSVLQKPKWYAQ